MEEGERWPRMKIRVAHVPCAAARPGGQQSTQRPERTRERDSTRERTEGEAKEKGQRRTGVSLEQKKLPWGEVNRLVKDWGDYRIPRKMMRKEEAIDENGDITPEEWKKQADYLRRQDQNKKIAEKSRITRKKKRNSTA